MAILFERDEKTICKHINNVFVEKEVEKEDSTQKMRVVGVKRLVPVSFGIQPYLSDGMFEIDMLTEYLGEIRQKVEYKKWFLGHYHDNKNVTTKDILLYEQIIRIP